MRMIKSGFVGAAVGLAVGAEVEGKRVGARVGSPGLGVGREVV